MAVKRFVDTNILLYRVSTVDAEAEKQRIAEEILAERDLSLSVQVLQEFYVQATRPSRSEPLSHEEAVCLIESWKRYPVVEISVELVDAALVAGERWRLSYWDSLIVEAARASGSTELLSEDLSHGQSCGGVVVRNPFSPV